MSVGNASTLVTYNQTLNNDGGPWNGSDTFTAPITGTYFFSIEFVKDAFYFGGTQDDVYVHLQVIPPGGPTTNPVSAWAGEATGKRGTGAVSTVLRLVAGTMVRTRAGSDGGPKRHISQVYFSGFYIAPRPNT